MASGVMAFLSDELSEFEFHQFDGVAIHAVLLKVASVTSVGSAASEVLDPHAKFKLPAHISPLSGSSKNRVS